MLDLVVVDGRARGIVTRDLVTGQARDPRRRRGRARAPAATATSSTSPTNAKGCNATAIWRAYKKGAAFANPCYTQIHPTCIPVARRVPVQAHPHERVAAQRRPHLGAEEEGRHAPAGPDPRGRARLLPRAQVPELRQPRPARHLLARGQAGLRRGARRRPGRPRRLPRLRRRHRAARATATIARAVRQPLRDVRAHHRRGPVQGPDAHLPGRRTTRWAGSGWTTT